MTADDTSRAAVRRYLALQTAATAAINAWEAVYPDATMTFGAHQRYPHLAAAMAELRRQLVAPPLPQP